MQIRRRCKCGCGGITKLGNKYINGHNPGNLSERSRLKLSISLMGNTNRKGCKGHKQSEEHILKLTLSRTKYDPNDPYCDIWKSKEYRDDLRKDCCENKNCKGNCKQLHNHHIDLDKKNCHPKNIMTLCNSCHSILHRKIQDGEAIAVNPKDFLVINRPDHITYINKKTRKMVKLRRIKLI